MPAKNAVIFSEKDCIFGGHLFIFGRLYFIRALVLDTQTTQSGHSAWSCNFKKFKIQETKLYVWNITFACFINLNKMPLKIEIHELVFAQQA